VSLPACGIDWRVTHVDGHVRLVEVIHVHDRWEARFPGLAAELQSDEYRRRIVAFAEKAKEPITGVEKECDEDDYDRELYPKFWEEYDGLLARHSGP